MSGSKQSSVNPSKDNLLCFCREPLRVGRSGTNKNPGRIFFGCPNWQSPRDCKFFKWADEYSQGGLETEEGKAEVKVESELVRMRRKMDVLQRTLERVEGKVDKNYRGNAREQNYKYLVYYFFTFMFGYICGKL